MKIRLSRPEELDELLVIYADARRFMAAHGNPTQWTGGYPSVELVQQEIAEGHSYVCVDEVGEIVGTFCFISGEDPSYTRIDEGDWLNHKPYSVLHRLAAKKGRKGIASACLAWCITQCENLRADTHRDNFVMQHILEKHDFQRCGIIYTHNGTPRIAYQKIIDNKKSRTTSGEHLERISLLL